MVALGLSEHTFRSACIASICSCSSCPTAPSSSSATAVGLLTFQRKQTGGVTFEYEDGTLSEIDATTLFSPTFGGTRIGNFFYTDQGYVSSVDGWKTTRARLHPAGVGQLGLSEFCEGEYLGLGTLQREPVSVVEILGEVMERFERGSMARTDFRTALKSVRESIASLTERSGKRTFGYSCLHHACP